MWRDLRDLTAPSDQSRLVRPVNPADRMGRKDLSGLYRRRCLLHLLVLLDQPAL